MSLLSEKLAPLWAAITRVEAQRINVFPATVTSVDPVRIQIDGQTAPLNASPDIGVPVGLGYRVRVIRYGTTHLIVSVMGSTTWQTLSLASGWTNASSSEPAQRRKVGDTVELRGEILSTDGQTGSGNPIAILPTSWHPRRRLRLATGWGPGGHANNITITVEINGTVWSSTGARATRPGNFLDGVRFSTAEA